MVPQVFFDRDLTYHQKLCPQVSLYSMGITKLLSPPGAYLSIVIVSPDIISPSIIV